MLFFYSVSLERSRSDDFVKLTPAHRLVSCVGGHNYYAAFLSCWVASSRTAPTPLPWRLPCRPVCVMWRKIFWTVWRRSRPRCCGCALVAHLIWLTHHAEALAMQIELKVHAGQCVRACVVTAHLIGPALLARTLAVKGKAHGIKQCGLARPGGPMH